MFWRADKFVSKMLAKNLAGRGAEVKAGKQTWKTQSGLLFGGMTFPVRQ